VPVPPPAAAATVSAAAAAAGSHSDALVFRFSHGRTKALVSEKECHQKREENRHQRK